MSQSQQQEIQIVQNLQTSPEIQACLQDIQDTMGIAWTPANWQAYAMYPALMQLLWKNLKPVVTTESFLTAALAIAQRTYLEVNNWYQPDYQIDVVETENQEIARELHIFAFGNPQLLIQQAILSRVLQGEKVGYENNPPPRTYPSPYRHPEIVMVDEQTAEKISPEIPQVYQDIKQTLRLPLVISDYQALAKWPAFFLAAWEDVSVEDLDVTVEDSRVTLSGTVPNWQAWQAAYNTAMYTGGVIDVIDRLAIRNP